MKTRFFALLDPNSDDAKRFKKDLNVLLLLKQEVIDVCVGGVFDRFKTIGNENKYNVLLDVSEKASIDLDIASSAVHVLTFLASYLSKDKFAKDPPRSLARDLISIDYMDKSYIDKFINIINIVNNVIIPRYKIISRKKIFSNGILPSLNSFSTTVEIRAVPEKEYKIGQSIDNYKSKIVDVVPVISVYISVNRGVVDEFVFQASKEEITEFINELRSAFMNLEALEDYLNADYLTVD